MIKNYGAPTVSTVGNVGDFYEDLDTGTVYRLVDVVVPDTEMQFVTRTDFVTHENQYIWKAVSGEGGVTSWNDLEDKPFGEVSEEQLLIDSTEIKFNGYDDEPLRVELTVEKFEPSGKEAYEILQPISTTGTPIRVVFDGVDYVFSNGFELSGEVTEGIPTAYLGNRGLDDDYPAPELDNDQPFLIRVGYFQVIIWFAEGETHTISMYCEQEKIKPLAPELGGVPTPTDDEGKVLTVDGGEAKWAAPNVSWNDLADKPFYEEEVESLLLSEVTVDVSDNKSTNANWELGTLGDYEAVNVVYDDVLYEDVPVLRFPGLSNDGSGDYCVGNGYHLKDSVEAPDINDYPFAIAQNSAWTQSWFETDGAHTVKVYAAKIDVTPLDAKYLPKAAHVPNIGTEPTASDFNALLASLRAAGYMA